MSRAKPRASKPKKLSATVLAYQKGRRRLTCYHEAGHLLARWYFGFASDYAVVLSVEQARGGVLIEDRKGRMIRAEGMVIGYDIHLSSGPPPDTHVEYKRDGRRLAEIALIETLAGIVASAAYTKQSWLCCCLGGGGQDWDQANQIARFRLDDPSAAIEVAWTRAAAVVRSPSGRRAIGANADMLCERGRIEGEEFNDICTEVYGRKPDYDAWSARWATDIDATASWRRVTIEVCRRWQRQHLPTANLEPQRSAAK